MCRLQFRQMNPFDLGAVHTIEKQAYSFPWSERLFLDCMNAGYSCVVAASHDVIVGYTILNIGAGEAHVMNLCVDPSHQGRGIGSALIESVMSEAKQQMCHRLLLEVRVSNCRAISIYQFKGFRKIGERRDYYPDSTGREDALVMGIDLGIHL